MGASLGVRSSSADTLGKVLAQLDSWIETSKRLSIGMDTPFLGLTFEGRIRDRQGERFHFSSEDSSFVLAIELQNYTDFSITRQEDGVSLSMKSVADWGPAQTTTSEIVLSEAA